MKLSVATSLTVLSVASAAVLQRQSGQPDYISAPPNLTTLANGSLYETWRPKAHVLPPFGSIGMSCQDKVSSS